MIRFEREQSYHFKVSNFQGYLQSKVRAKCHDALRKYALSRIRKYHANLVARTHYVRSRRFLLIREWMQTLPLLRAENQLVAMLENDRAMYLQRKSMAALRHYALYHKQRVRSD